MRAREARARATSTIATGVEGNGRGVLCHKRLPHGQDVVSPKRVHRCIGLVVGGLVFTAITTAVPVGAATTPLPEPLDITANACPPSEVPEDGFRDVQGGNVHEFSIDCLEWYDIANGASANLYHPEEPVKRDQMASFLARLIDYAASEESDPDPQDGIEAKALPVAPKESRFPCDLDASNVHFNNIQRLAAANIVEGTGLDSSGRACFDPNGNVTRAQMASFIDATMRYSTNIAVVSADANYFADDDGDFHEGSINNVAARRVTRGTDTGVNGDAVYSPGSNVPRDQMATFVARILESLVVERFTSPPSR